MLKKWYYQVQKACCKPRLRAGRWKGFDAQPLLNKPDSSGKLPILSGLETNSGTAEPIKN